MDAEITYSDIKNKFGVEVADGVLALPKNSELPKSERMIDSLARIRLQPKVIWMVKMSDRITNLQPPPKHWGKSKIKDYRDEAILILENFGRLMNFLTNDCKLRFQNMGNIFNCENSDLKTIYH